MEQREVVVVGGGISGLSLAHYGARAGLDVLLLEKENRTGGAFHSEKLDSDEGFWLELGAHTCYNSYGNLLDLVVDCSIADSLIPRNAVPFKLWTESGLKSVVSQLSFFGIAKSLPGFFSVDKSTATVEEYYGTLVGRRNYEKVVRHFLNAVPSQETGGFPADMLFKKRARRKDFLKSYTFSSGVQTVVDRIALVTGAEVRRDSDVLSVRLDADRYLVSTEDGEVSAKHLVLATPVSVSAGLMRDIDDKVASHLSTVKMSETHSVGVVVKHDDVGFEPVAGIVSPDDLFYSVVSRDTVSDPDYRGFTFHFKPDVADEVRQWKRICEVLGLPRSKVVKSSAKTNRLPALARGHAELMSRVDDLLAGMGVYITGNYFGGLAIEDCVTRSVAEFQRLMKKRV